MHPKRNSFPSLFTGVFILVFIVTPAFPYFIFGDCGSTEFALLFDSRVTALRSAGVWEWVLLDEPFLTLIERDSGFLNERCLLRER